LWDRWTETEYTTEGKIEMALKQDLKAMQKEFKESGKKVAKLTKAVEKAEKTQAKATKAKAVVKAPAKKKAPVKKTATAAKTKTTKAKKPVTNRSHSKQPVRSIFRIVRIHFISHRHGAGLDQGSPRNGRTFSILTGRAGGL
jgi:hypothetical protein